MSDQSANNSNSSNKKIPRITNVDFQQLNQEIDNTTDYEQLYETDGIEMHVKKSGEGSDDESGIARYKYFGSMDYDIDLVFAVFRDDEHRHTWDSRDLGREILQVFKPQNEEEPVNSVVWTTKLGQYMVSNRDFVSLQACKRHTRPDGETESFELYTKGIEEFKEPTSEFVRAHIIYLGIKLWRDQNDPTKTRYVCITQVSPGGWITSSLVNWAVKYVPSEFEQNLVKGCEYRLENKMDSERWKILDF